VGEPRGRADVAGGAPVWPYPEILDGYALPLEGPGLGIETNEALVDEELAASKPFVPLLQVPRLRGPVEWVGWVGAGFLNAPTRVRLLGQLTLALSGSTIPSNMDPFVCTVEE
jgi:hypothetical protein